VCEESATPQNGAFVLRGTSRTLRLHNHLMKICSTWNNVYLMESGSNNLPLEP
jgi:hypothetical protein